MCQAAIYLNDKKIMEDVIWLEPAEEGILARAFFDEPRLIKGFITGIDLLKHRVLMVSVEESQGLGIGD